MFEEGEADDAVVCGFVVGDCGVAEGGLAREGAGDAGGVEDLVDAVLVSLGQGEGEGGATYKGESSLGRRAPCLINNLVFAFG